MRAEATIRDPRHGVALPAGTGLARAVSLILRRWRQVAVAGLARGQVAALPVDEGTVEALLPFFVRYWRQGAQRVVSPPRYNRSYRGRRKALSLGFDVFSDFVLQAIRQMVFAFLAELSDGTEDMLRRALAESLAGGETGLDLQRRLLPIFGPGRAAVVGVTESSRSVHRGQLDQAKAEGVAEAKTWLASADACPLCLALDDVTVPLDQPFVTGYGKNPAYSTIMHPPYHVRCQCTMTLEV